MLLYFVKQDKKMAIDAKMDIYDSYWFYKEIFTNENLHGKGLETTKKINEMSKKVEQMRCERSLFSDKLSMINGINFYRNQKLYNIISILPSVEHCRSIHGRCTLPRCILVDLLHSR